MGYYTKKKSNSSSYSNHQILENKTVDRGMDYHNIFKYGSTSTISSTDCIKQSIYQILITPVGSRFFLPAYGCRVGELLFEPNDDIVKDLAELYIKDAISTWETRVTVDNVVVTPNDTKLDIRIYYTNNLTLSKDLFNVYIGRGENF